MEDTTAEALTPVSHCDRALCARAIPFKSIRLTGKLASLIGEQGIDTLNGGANNDTLDGGFSADILYGGPGNDTYIIAGLYDGDSFDFYPDSVTEVANSGRDTIQLTVPAIPKR